MICTSKKKENEARWLLELPRGTGWEPLGGSQHTSGHQQPACRIVFAKLNELPVKSSPASSTVSTFCLDTLNLFCSRVWSAAMFSFAMVTVQSDELRAACGDLGRGRRVQPSWEIHRGATSKILPRATEHFLSHTNMLLRVKYVQCVYDNFKS